MFRKKGNGNGNGDSDADKGSPEADAANAASCAAQGSDPMAHMNAANLHAKAAKKAPNAKERSYHEGRAKFHGKYGR
jgi:hypothetical protein